MKIRSACKLIFLYVSYVLAKCLKHTPAPAILMYHSFDTTGWRYGVSPDDVKKHLTYLRQHKTIVPLEQFVSHVAGSRILNPDTVAITVDDGYADTYEVLFPLAKQYQIPFTLFLTTDLAPQKNLGNLLRPTMEQLTEMAESGLVTFGLHGHTHQHFTTVFQEKTISSEIIDSEEIIKSITGTAPQFVAYPSGRYDETVLEHFRQSGYVLGLTAHSGFVTPHVDPLRLRRVEVARQIASLPIFHLRLTPALLVYNRLISWFKTYVY